MTVASYPEVEHPQSLTADQVIASLDTDATLGLTAAEARRRLARDGPNALPSAPPDPTWLRFLRQFCDWQVYLLLAAVLVSLVAWIMEGASGLPYEALAILAIVLLNALFGFLQEEQADRALSALRSMTPALASVVRDGQEQRIEARHLVPGDLLVVREGDRIAADARLITVAALLTQESALTGESLPVTKSIAPVSPATSPAECHNMVFSGTTAVYGHATAIVTATGRHTEFGRIAALLHQTEERQTPLKKELNHLGKRLGVAVVAIAAVVVGSLLLIEGIHNGERVLQILLFGVALAVAATPEGLAAVVTVVLALGVRRMARRGAIVRHLAAVEALGEATVIASDKTGTMTMNAMAVRSVVTASGLASLASSWSLPGGDPVSPAHLAELRTALKAAALVNNATLQRENGAAKPQGDPTEAALLLAADQSGIDLAELARECPRLGEIPFSSERKRMSTLHRCPAIPAFGACALITKGAADVLLPLCAYELTSQGSHALTPERRAELLQWQETLAAQGLRTLGIAFRPMPADACMSETPEPNREQNPEPNLEQDVEQDLTFLALIAMLDAPRPEVAAAVAKARAAGVRSIMMTGDHATTALAIARELGISTGDGVLTGRQLAQLTDEDLASAVQRVSVFARVNPEHKLRLVNALQRNREIVAMTGDGVNDAPALKAANIGIAMGITGTEVAKEAADLVLTDDNFATIVAAIEEGRGLFDNIRKFLRYLLATNFGEILTLFLAVVFAALLGTMTREPMLPLLAVQILWINLITDGAPALALGLDPTDPGVMRAAPFAAEAGIVDRPMLVDIVIVAAIMAAGTLWMFFQGANRSPLILRRTLAFTTLILFQLFNAFQSRSSTRSVFAGLLRNRWLWGSTVSMVALQVLVLDLPFLERAFQTVPLSPEQWMRCALIASTVVWGMEAVKWVRRNYRRRSL